MKYRAYIIITLLWCGSVSAQDFTGQWKGIFTQETTKSKLAHTYEYVLELKQKDNTITGTSYSYYVEKGKKYYSICAVVARKKKGTNKLEIWETKRTKTNNNSNYSGLQHHQLQYSLSENKETLSGTWNHVYEKNVEPATGKTKLERNKQQETLTQISKAIKQKKEALAQATAAKKQKSFAGKIKNTDTVSSIISKTLSTVSASKVETRIATAATISIPEKLGSYNNYKSRKKNYIRTFYTSSKTLIVDLYDNGEMDGDSVTLLFNEKVVALKQMLRNKPISFLLEMDQQINAESEMVMYAENLGTIPPNTALMIISDGKKRYEVRVSSDLQQSGAIKFIATKPAN